MTTFLRLIREPSDAGATLGSLYINDVWQCWTLEDAIRETPIGLRTDRVAWVDSWKVPGRTAIPAGTYGVAMTHSVRFNKVLPILLEVPGFTGIRIHAGNTDLDTEGCILVGDQRAGPKVLDSRAALQWLLLRLKSNQGGIVIAVENPPGRHLTPPPPLVRA